MNFYKHHLGDYDGATSHLSWDEDMAYSRLMRVYYRREQPIPDADRYRLVRATSKVQRAAVDCVLSEYFTRSGDSWRNKRCDEEIEQYHAQAAVNKRIAQDREQARNVRRNGHDSLHGSLRSREPSQNQNHKPDVDVSGLSEAPTRQVKGVLQKIPSEPNPEDIDRNRRIANATAAGNMELARQIRDGTA